MDMHIVTKLLQLRRLFQYKIRTHAHTCAGVTRSLQYKPHHNRRCGRHHNQNTP